MGDFLLYPSLAETLIYNDNVFASAADPEADLVLKSAGDFIAQSDWGRHALSFGAFVSDYRHAEFTSEDHTDVGGRTRWRFDIANGMSLSGKASAARLYEARGESDTPEATAEPTPYGRYDASMAFAKRFNRLSFEIGAEADRFDYDDVASNGGGIIDQDDRDHDIYALSFSTAYEFSPGRRIFAETEVNRKDFRANPDGPERDSRGASARLGLGFEVTQIMAIELSGGYLEQDFDDETLSDLSGLGLKGGLLWNPTRLMTVSLTGERRISETSYSGASAHFDTLITGRIDYEILRNLIGSPFVEYLLQDYQGIERSDETLKAGLELQYLVNRNFSTGAFYDFTLRDSNLDQLDYERNRIGGTLKLRF